MDFSKLEYDPTVLGKDELIWEKYPDLQVNPAFCSLSDYDIVRGLTLEDLSKLVSFVILYVDSLSPYYKETDIEKRVEGCAKTLKIKRGSLVYSEIEAYTDTYSNILYEYFRSQNSILFEHWLSLKIAIAETYKYLRSPIGMGDSADQEAFKRSQVLKSINQMKKEVLESEARLFPSSKIQTQINRESVKKSLKRFAEQYALTHPALGENKE